MYLYMYNQWGIKRRGHVPPKTLPIDSKILDVTKNSASGCSCEHTFTSVSESLQVLLQCNTASACSASSIQCLSLLLVQACLLQYKRYGRLKYLWIRWQGHSPGTVRCCLSSAAAEYPVVPSIVLHKNCTMLDTACTGRCIVFSDKFHRRSFSRHSVKIVYCNVHLSARIDHSTRKAI